MATMDAKLALNAEPSVWSRIAALRQNSLDVLAPAMRAAVVATLKRAQGETVSVTLACGHSELVVLDPMVHETFRTNTLQAIYYAQGATKASTAEHSWHFYGLAVDVISSEYEWFDGLAARTRWPLAADRATVSAAWFRAIATAGAAFGLASGLDWPSFPDPPHLQWGRCARSPQTAPTIYHNAGGELRGRQAVWRAVGADTVPTSLAEALA